MAQKTYIFRISNSYGSTALNFKIWRSSVQLDCIYVWQLHSKLFPQIFLLLQFITMFCYYNKFMESFKGYNHCRKTLLAKECLFIKAVTIVNLWKLSSDLKLFRKSLSKRKQPCSSCLKFMPTSWEMIKKWSKITKFYQSFVPDFTSSDVLWHVSVTYIQYVISCSK